MEQNNIPASENNYPTSKASDLNRFFLPGTILIAAIIISGSILYANRDKSGVGNDNQAPQGQQRNKVDISIDNAPVLGNPKAKVTIVEFADFRCPFCERFSNQTGSQIIKNYVDTGKARFVFKHFAFLGQQSVWAAEASECAKEQWKFWEYHNWLYQNQAPESDLAYYSKTNLTKYAGNIAGIDTVRFASCLNKCAYSKNVAKDLSQGQSAGVTGTPTVFINGVAIVGAQPYAVFKSAIEEALKN